MPITQIEEPSFEKEVLQADRPVLVDFWAPWCAPCRVQHPIIEELAKEIADSKRILEEHLGKQILHFATPFGEINARGIATVRAAGYLTCRTTDDGVSHSAARLLKLRANVITDDFSAFVEVLNE